MLGRGAGYALFSPLQTRRLGKQLTECSMVKYSSELYSSSQPWRSSQLSWFPVVPSVPSPSFEGALLGPISVVARASCGLGRLPRLDTGGSPMGNSSKEDAPVLLAFAPVSEATVEDRARRLMLRSDSWSWTCAARSTSMRDMVTMRCGPNGSSVH